MSMDRCYDCDRLVDTDYDLDCYIAVTSRWDICVCEACRERRDEQGQQQEREAAENGTQA